MAIATNILPSYNKQRATNISTNVCTAACTIGQCNDNTNNRKKVREHGSDKTKQPSMAEKPKLHFLINFNYFRPFGNTKNYIQPEVSEWKSGKVKKWKVFEAAM